MKKLSAALLSIVLVAMGAMLIFAQTGDGQTDGKRGFGKRGHFGKHGGGGHGKMLRALDLTEQQKAQVKQIIENSRANAQPIREQMRANREKLRELSANGNFDAVQVQAIAAQQGNLTAQMIVEKERVKSQIFQILTPEQRAKAAELRQQMRERRQERMQNKSERRQNRSGESIF